MKRVAIVQSNYIPWKGYFDMIAAVDEFILFDDVQYTRRDWRNRNRIKTPQGVQWLTVPVQVKGRYLQSIRETIIDGESWAQDHWKTIALNYSKSAYFQPMAKVIEPLYLQNKYRNLSEMNRLFIKEICSILGIHTTISTSSDYSLVEGKTERLAYLCVQANATEYISGSAAKDYLDTGVLERHGIKVKWFDYNGYRPYPQLWGDFVHEVTILDLLFNCGLDAKSYMRYVDK